MEEEKVVELTKEDLDKVTLAQPVLEDLEVLDDVEKVYDKDKKVRGEGVNIRYFKKPIITMKEYCKLSEGGYKERDIILGDGNFSCIISGKSGSGKDTIMQSLMEVDLEQGRTPIIFDVKMEYPSSIFLQRDDKLIKILMDSNLLPTSHKIKLWIPYVAGLEKDKHFKRLLKYKHPNLEVIPFRILEEKLQSDDTKNFALGMTLLQSYAGKDAETGQKLKGISKSILDYKTDIARKYMIFDSKNRRTDDCNWEYLDFDALTRNKCVNIISFYFMIKGNTMTAISIMIGIVNEFLSIAMNYREKEFSIFIPELQLMLPRRVKQLEDTVNTLIFRLTIGFLLLRSFFCRARINLQNLTRLPEDLFSQSRIFIGRTLNPKDLTLLKYNFGFTPKWVSEIRCLPIGTFLDVERHGNKKLFHLVPKSHKALEKEPFLKLLVEHNFHPENFLYETPCYFLTDLNIFDNELDKFSVYHYRKKVLEWVKSQKVFYPKKLEDDVDYNIVDEIRKENKTEFWRPRL